MPSTVQIAPPTRAQRARAAVLLAEIIGFAPRDAIPAWLTLTTDEAGGLTLVAVEKGEVVGASYAIAAREGRQHSWFSCGLAVAPRARRHGLARALKLEQRDRARAAGITRIRWTADALNAPALRLYLSELGARLVDHRPGQHAGLRAPGLPDDDVDVVWDIDGSAPCVGPPCVAIPLPPRGDAATRRRLAGALHDALARGLVGIAVEPERSQFVLRMACEVP